MFWYLLVSAALAGTLAAPTADPSGMYVTPNDTKTCANDLIKWCDGMNYPQEGIGMSMVSVVMRIGTEYCRVLCVSDQDGTNCTKNGQPWFSCSKEHEFLYEGKPVDPQDPGEGVCETAEKAFNDIMVQGMTYDNQTVSEAVEKGIEVFFKEMAEMREMIDVLFRRLNSFEIGWPFGWKDPGASEIEEDQIERE